MASNNRSGGNDAVNGIAKLKADVETLDREAHARESPSPEDYQTQLRMATLIEEQMNRPTTINSIEVHGAKNTRRGFLGPIFQPLVNDKNNAGTTLKDVLERLREATAKLDRFEIFRSEPTVYLSDATASDPAAAATDLDISIRVAERGRFRLSTGTDLGNTEGSAYGNLLWRNMFGGAETLSLNASAGTRTRSAYSAVLSTPLRSNPNLRLSLEGVASATQKPWASHEEAVRGTTARLAWLSGADDAHSIALTGAWRQLTGLDPATASPSVRHDAGDSVKTSLSHTFTRDRRDNPLLPQSGYLVRSVTELAGWGPLGGDVSFSKSEVEVAGALPLGGTKTGVSVGGGLRFGLLYPLPLGYSLGGKALPSRVNDRFQLGGPTDVRGFKIGGLGPRDGADAVGGDVFAAGSVNMLLPLPRTGAESPLRLQLFANGGRLVGLKSRTKASSSSPRGSAAGSSRSSSSSSSTDSTDSSSSQGMESGAVMKGMAGALRELAHGLPSLAAGIGLVYAHPVARFELNFSLPLVMRRGEEGRKGLQVGVGINFM